MKNRLWSILNFSLVMLDLYKMREQGPQSKDSAVRGANNMTGLYARVAESVDARDLKSLVR